MRSDCSKIPTAIRGHIAFKKALLRLMAFLLVLAPPAGACPQQTATLDQTVLSAIGDEDFLRLDSLLRQAPDSLSQWMGAFSRSLTDHCLNRKQAAVGDLQDLMNTHGKELSKESRIFLTGLLSDNLSRLGKNREASLMILSLLSRFQYEGKDVLRHTGLFNVERRYRTMAGYSLYQMPDREPETSSAILIDSVSLTEERIPRMSLEAQIGRAHEQAVLSTSSGMNLITESLALRLGLEVMSQDAQGNRNEVSVGGLVLAKELNVGNLKMRNVPFEVIGDDAQDRSGKSYLSHFRMVLGVPFLEAVGCVELDFKARQVRFSTVERHLSQKLNLMLDLSTGGLLYRLCTAQQERYTLFLDTGSGTSMLSSEYFSRHMANLRQTLELRPLVLTSVQGATGYSGYRMRDFRILQEGTSLTLPRMDVSPSPVDEENIKDGVLGIDALSSFSKVIIDMDHMRLSLIP